MFYQILLFAFCISLGTAQERCVCPPGTFHITATTCKKCSAGTFQAESGQSSCIPCPTNQFSNSEGSTSCKPCGKNSFPSKNTATKCACKSIKYPNEFPPTKGCLRNTCGPGMFPMSSKYGGSFCSPCFSGFFKPGDKGDCKPCPKGTFSDKGRTTCTKCKKGELLVSTRRCGVCPPGKQPIHFDQEGDSNCMKCSPGSFKAKAGNQNCETCPRGTTSLEQAKECVKCPNGTELLKNGECGLCDSGEHYDPFTGNCEKCSPGHFAPKANVDYYVCRECPKGTFAVKEGASKCLPCPKGSVMFPSGKCKACPKGTYYDAYNVKCERCSGDSIGRGGDARACKSCSRNKWSNKMKTSCVTCPEGTVYLEETGKCGKCKAGYYFDSNYFSGGPPGCNRCAYGFTATENIVYFCESCPKGEIPTEKNTRCLPECKVND